VKETHDQHDAQVQTLRSARRSYQMALEAFHGGTTTILNVFTAEEAVTAAEDSESQSHIAYMHALISLYQALGGGWTKPAATTQVLASHNTDEASATRTSH
jgi:multidrug efflux system outer membrane protein